ncbi:MAG: Maf family nucleotide pyrophosphatase [Aestuariivita sp.]|nr:Maf family nucleotide pyrophosphatase [Aestuariivita sp.]MCY4202570.1 Maf family nucleotide pyrophosphatase [Aestuariivita sp.]
MEKNHRFLHKDERIILASSSTIRADLLKRAGVDVEMEAPRVDEEAIRKAMKSQGATPREVVDTLAAAKARKISLRRSDKIVIGSDQIVEHNGIILSKPKTIAVALQQLENMAGQRHRILTAVVVCENGADQWRHIETVELTMRRDKGSYLNEYVERNWQRIKETVGGYKLEEEGVRLMKRIDGDYFSVLGLPLVPLLGYLTDRGILAG